MPQLMPFFWILSVFMVTFLMMTSIFLYYLKKKECNFFCFYTLNSIYNYNYMW